METAVISYRVADFLKQHAPFHAIEEADLLALAGGGRVRFFEPNEYILWQGEPHRFQVFVIQQGTVSLWEEQPDGAKLRDVRGAGDMLGIERYNGARACLYTARSDSDVVVYGFQAHDFETFVLKYPQAAGYVAAESQVTTDYRPAGARPELSRTFLHGAVRGKALATCSASETLSDVARQLLTTRSEAILVLDSDRRARGVLTADDFVRWVAADAGCAQIPVETLPFGPLQTVSPDASVADGLLKMGAFDVDALAMTDGTAAGSVQALVTRRDLGTVIGDDPATLLRQTRVAGSVQELNALNHRTRSFVLEHLVGTASVEWLTRLTSLVDASILNRLLVLTGVERMPASWCFGGSAGRAEALTKAAPTLLALFDDGVAQADRQAAFQRVLDGLLACGYLPRPDLPFDADFYAAGASEWSQRYRDWVSDPVLKETYRARSLFDLRFVGGHESPWQAVRATIVGARNPAFIHLLANDCLDSLPPLTFFQDAVVDNSGEQTDTFRLEYSALRPLVDVARVFALAAQDALGRSSLERFAIAGTLLPERDAIFREASDTLRIVLWQQGRVGIGQGTSGTELPAATLSRHDRQVLKSGFRSILRLLEFTGDREWLKAL